jgi:DUF1680 family protein
VDVTTDYPHDGTVTVRVTETDGRPWALTLRVPPWAARAELADAEGFRAVAPGSVVVERPFAVGDEVTLTLPMAPRWTHADPRIDAVRGCVAAERGPLVLCAESIDLPGQSSVDVVRVDSSVAASRQGRRGRRHRRIDRPARAGGPYGPDAATEGDEGPVEIPLIPYHDWANRDPSTMRVWLPTS